VWVRAPILPPAKYRDQYIAEYQDNEELRGVRHTAPCRENVLTTGIKPYMGRLAKLHSAFS